MTEQPDKFINTELGGCKILEKLGFGGTGSIYRAHHIGLDKIVCIKILSPDLAKDERHIQFFLREARSAAQLKHPNIVGMKDSSSPGPVRFLTALDTSDEFHILAGSVNSFYPSLHLGAVGGILSLANCLPESCCELYKLFFEKRFDEARNLHFRLARLNSAVSGTWGVAGVKAAMDITGFKGGKPRHPLTPVPEEALENIRARIHAEGFKINL